jgi:FkbM family methyltransferase
MQNFFQATPLRPFFDTVDLVAYDLGARGGFDPSLEAIAWRVNAVAFEPERQAYEKLRAQGAGDWKSFAVHPVAISDRIGPATLYVPAEPTGASLLKRHIDVGKRYGCEHLFEPVSEITVETTTLEQARLDFAIPAPDFIKLDIEGLELRVIKSAVRLFDSVSAIKTESSFIEMGADGSRAHDLIATMEGLGFELMEIVQIHDWRKKTVPAGPYLPKPPEGFSKGRIAQGDLIFLRSPGTLSRETARPAIAIAMAMGYFDHAEDLMKAAVADTLIAADSLPDTDRLHAVSRTFGRIVARRELYARLRSTIPLCRSLLTGI